MDLSPILAACTEPVRHNGQPIVSEHDAGPIHVTEIYGYLATEADVPPDIEKRDVHFFVVAVDKAKAEQYRPSLIEWLTNYPEPERLAGGPSYIEIGARVGSQEAALRLFALGDVLGLWKLITPERLGITGPEADALAGNGLVMISGWKA
jgi:hypothetical protein